MNKRERVVQNTAADYQNKWILGTKRILMSPFFLVVAIGGLFIYICLFCICEMFPKQLDEIIGSTSGRGS